MGRLAGFSYREVVKKLHRLGFNLDHQSSGSHETWFNPTTNKYTILSKHTKDMPEGTLRNILKKTGVTPAQFLDA